ncbi:unnamed protein product, partial [Tetraodon nigroviridis]
TSWPQEHGRPGQHGPCLHPPPPPQVPLLGGGRRHGLPPRGGDPAQHQVHFKILSAPHAPGCGLWGGVHNLCVVLFAGLSFRGLAGGACSAPPVGPIVFL